MVDQAKGKVLANDQAAASQASATGGQNANLESARAMLVAVMSGNASAEEIQAVLGDPTVANAMLSDSSLAVQAAMAGGLVSERQAALLAEVARTSGVSEGNSKLLEAIAKDKQLEESIPPKPTEVAKADLGTITPSSGQDPNLIARVLAEAGLTPKVGGHSRA